MSLEGTDRPAGMSAGPPDHATAPGAGLADAPSWLRDLADRAAHPDARPPLVRSLPPAGQPGQRQSAVLLLFAGTGAGEHRGPPDDLSIMLTERAHTLRSHPGQVSFPGGRAEPTDLDLAATALRETHEEVGVPPDSVAVAGVLPPINLVVSSHDVSPVLGWWARPGRAWAREPGEVARVLQVPVAELADPAHRFRVGHPGGWVGPAFQADDLVVWGFTAMVLDGILQLGGWELPWDESDVRPVP